MVTRVRMFFSILLQNSSYLYALVIFYFKVHYLIKYQLSSQCSLLYIALVKKISWDRSYWQVIGKVASVHNSDYISTNIEMRNRPGCTQSRWYGFCEVCEINVSPAPPVPISLYGLGLCCSLVWLVHSGIWSALVCSRGIDNYTSIIITA